jgi:galactose mutarotase-like enzyme
MLRDRPMTITLRSNNLSATIALKGANLVSLKKGGAEYMWHGGPEWPKPGGTNVIFPAFGQITHDNRYACGGTVYEMPKHGFAKDKTFAVISHDESRALLRLEADAETRRYYPFAFTLDMSFALSDGTLDVDYALRNKDEKDLLCSLGSHPAFVRPLPGEDAVAPHTVTFEKNEPSPLRRPRAGLLDGAVHPSPLRGNILDLTPELFEGDALFFVDDPGNLNAAAAATRFSSTWAVFGGAKARMKMNWRGFRNLGVWSKPGAAFLCLEPFSGNSGSAHTHYKDTPPELSAIPHLLRLKPGTEFKAGYMLTL